MDRRLWAEYRVNGGVLGAWDEIRELSVPQRPSSRTRAAQQERRVLERSGFAKKLGVARSGLQIAHRPEGSVGSKRPEHWAAKSSACATAPLLHTRESVLDLAADMNDCAGVQCAVQARCVACMHGLRKHCVYTNHSSGSPMPLYSHPRPSMAAAGLTGHDSKIPQHSLHSDPHANAS